MPVKKNTVPIGQLLYAVGEVETGHITPMSRRYTIVNHIGAHGRYQVMRGNIASWTKEAFGRAYTPAQFLADPKAQDKLAAFRLDRDQQKHGDWRAAVSIWFSGQPNWNSSASDDHFTVPQYISAAQKHLATGKTISGAGGSDAGASADFDQAGLVDDLGDTLLAPFKVIAAGAASTAKSLTHVGAFAEFLMKLALPSTWVRAACGALGMAFLIFGLVVLGREAKGT